MVPRASQSKPFPPQPPSTVKAAVPIKSSPLAVSSGSGGTWAEKQAAKKLAAIETKTATPLINDHLTEIKPTGSRESVLFRLQSEDWQSLWDEVSKFSPLPPPSLEFHPSYPLSISLTTALDDGDVFTLAGISALLDEYYPGSIQPPHAYPDGSLDTPFEFTMKRLKGIMEWTRSSLLNKGSSFHPWCLQGEGKLTDFYSQDGAFQEALDKRSVGEGHKRGRRRMKRGTTGSSRDLSVPPHEKVGVGGVISSSLENLTGGDAAAVARQNASVRGSVRLSPPPSPLPTLRDAGVGVFKAAANAGSPNSFFFLKPVPLPAPLKFSAALAANHSATTTTTTNAAFLAPPTFMGSMLPSPSSSSSRHDHGGRVSPRSHHSGLDMSSSQVGPPREVRVGNARMERVETRVASEEVATSYDEILGTTGVYQPTSASSWALPWAALLEGTGIEMELERQIAREVGEEEACCAAIRASVRFGEGAAEALVHEEAAAGKLLASRIKLRECMEVAVGAKRKELHATRAAWGAASKEYLSLESRLISRIREETRQVEEEAGITKLALVGRETEAALSAMREEGAMRIRDIGEVSLLRVESSDARAAAGAGFPELSSQQQQKRTLHPSGVVLEETNQRIGELTRLIDEQISHMSPQAICKALYPLHTSSAPPSHPPTPRLLHDSTMVSRFLSSTYAPLRELGVVLAQAKERVLSGDRGGGTASSPPPTVTATAALHPLVKPSVCVIAPRDTAHRFVTLPPPAATEKSQLVSLHSRGAGSVHLSAAALGGGEGPGGAARHSRAAGILIRSFLSKGVLEAPYDPVFGDKLAKVLGRLTDELKARERRGEEGGEGGGMGRNNGGTSSYGPFSPRLPLAATLLYDSTQEKKMGGGQQPKGAIFSKSGGEVCEKRYPFAPAPPLQSFDPDAWLDTPIEMGRGGSRNLVIPGFLSSPSLSVARRGRF